MRINSDDKGVEFGKEKRNMLIMKSWKRKMTEEIQLPNKEESERSVKILRKTWEYWKGTQ